eukprot:CAMPEP_0179055400 /NCGR_PEP_ID=MMETSP0796-20121207/23281_1 /TAXON_ID=73915 /ORGANISM="Pyrodinium bahamense, Strain pbaha01" /LENGTH=129 /DNA_ID=CAMNT_0020752051 /DNA_START=27 /DNA_END=413 /DNA_ORIENTATION=+
MKEPRGRMRSLRMQHALCGVTICAPVACALHFGYSFVVPRPGAVVNTQSKTIAEPLQLGSVSHDGMQGGVTGMGVGAVALALAAAAVAQSARRGRQFQARATIVPLRATKDDIDALIAKSPVLVVSKAF